MPLPAIRRPRRLAPTLAWLPMALALWSTAPAAAPAAAGVRTSLTPVANSSLDGQLFYQILLGEFELARGEPGVAYQVVLDAAKRTKDEALFQRAVDIAIGGRAGEQALTSAKAWRSAAPKSARAAEVQAQLQMALGRPADAGEALRSLLELTPEGERLATIAKLPRMVNVGQNKTAAASVVDEALKPWRGKAETRVAATVASARSWAIVGENAKALEGLREAQRFDASNDAAAMLALDLFPKEPEAEAAIMAYLKAKPEGSGVRLSLARRLTSAQRYKEALEHAQSVTRSDPKQAGAWMLEGALLIELAQPKQAQVALKRYLEVAREQDTQAAAARAASDEDDEESPQEAGARNEETSQAYLMLAQSSEQLKDYAGAQAWLDMLGDTKATVAVQSRRANLLARQGKLKEARALLQALPERSPEELRSKVLAETQLLREMRAWKEAFDVLERANARLPDDADLLYEQALLAERLTRFDDMEQQLRRVIRLKPDQQHAYNALGYSLADRSIRLDEARQLVQKALELAPGDPFITDSLAWVEFRQGRRETALALLKQAYEKRPDTEIGAHLGEVLWALGQQDEARRIWRAGHERDAENEVLSETLKRLKVRL